MLNQTVIEVSVASHKKYPMTEEAREAVAREIDELAVARRDEPGHGVYMRDGKPVPLIFPRLTRWALDRRLATLRAVLAAAVVVQDPVVAAIGRRVTIAESDGGHEQYSLVLPGDGDPSNGWVSADSPLGAALLGCAAGDDVVVHAPAGSRTIRILGVEPPAPHRSGGHLSRGTTGFSRRSGR